ncbi:unnamed protein product [Rotaria sordida]|nr:unnamed protein product [Rotaria sordida]
MVTKDGRFQSQRVLPRMALIRPSVVKDGLCLRAPNMPELNVSVNPLPDEVVHCYYRLKPNPYGVSPLFGINVAPTDENSIGAMIRVGDMVYVRTEEPDFWSKIDSLQ